MSGYSVPNLLVPSPFRQLAALLDGLEPGAPVIDLSIGAPQHPLPDFVAEEFGTDLSPLSNYPAITGLPDFRAAVVDWLRQRYGLAKAVDTQHVLAINGSREGLFYAAFLAKDICNKDNPCIILPNPGYPTYVGAAKAAACEIITFPETKDGLCWPTELAEDALKSAVAVYFHAPSNPQGATASMDLWQAWIQAARHYSFFLLADECYSEIYRSEPPIGALQAGLALGGDAPFQRIIALNSLSKRSNIPGLRVGFVAGDPDFMAAFTAFRNVSGPQMPVPAQRVGIRALRDETHVAENRRLYNEKFELARSILGVEPPEGGFFLWLDCGEVGGEAIARRLWVEAGIKSVPGTYLTYTPSTSQALSKVISEENSRATSTAATSNERASDRYLRLALVAADLSTTKEALERVARVFPVMSKEGSA